MSGITCPSCKKPAMSYFKKLIMSPAIGFKCQSCGKQMAVDMEKAMGIVIIFGVLGFGIFQLVLNKVILSACLSIVIAGLIYLFIPLIEAEDNYKYYE